MSFYSNYHKCPEYVEEVFNRIRKLAVKDSRYSYYMYMEVIKRNGVLDSVCDYSKFDWQLLDILYENQLNGITFSEVITRLSKRKDIPLEYLDKYAHYWDWRKISKRDDLTEEFILKFIQHLDLQLILEYNYLSSDFINTLKILKELKV